MSLIILFEESEMIYFVIACYVSGMMDDRDAFNSTHREFERGINGYINIGINVGTTFPWEYRENTADIWNTNTSNLNSRCLL